MDHDKESQNAADQKVLDMCKSFLVNFGTDSGSIHSWIHQIVELAVTAKMSSRQVKAGLEWYVDNAGDVPGFISDDPGYKEKWAQQRARIFDLIDKQFLEIRSLTTVEKYVSSTQVDWENHKDMKPINFMDQSENFRSLLSSLKLAIQEGSLSLSTARTYLHDTFFNVASFSPEEWDAVLGKKRQ